MIRRFLEPGDVGRPQFIAAALLLVYLLQCAWLVHVQTAHHLLPNPDHALRVYQGLKQWQSGVVAGTPGIHGGEPGVPPRLDGRDARLSTGQTGHLRVRDGYDQDRSPLYYLIAAAPLLLMPSALAPDSTLGQLWIRAPYFFFGVMLGGSLWYVARRLYGNSGGYIALALYCFSPAMIVNVAGAQSLGEMGAVWGAFGTVFTAIAVAHTLYAPREVVLWNWRRILLLGLSLTLAAGNQFSLAILALVALPLMLWVAPIRRIAVLLIWTTACGFAAFLLFAAYFAEPSLFFHGLTHARWLDFQPRAFLAAISYAHLIGELSRGAPPTMIVLPAALPTYAAWKRARYFGNTAPLLMAALLLVLAVAAPAFPGQGFHLAALVLLFVFVAGVFADLIESRQGGIVTAALGGLLSAAAIWNLLQLARLA